MNRRISCQKQPIGGEGSSNSRLQAEKTKVHHCLACRSRLPHYLKGKLINKRGSYLIRISCSASSSMSASFNAFESRTGWSHALCKDISR